MALSASTLSGLIITNLGGSASGFNTKKGSSKIFADALAKAIVDHIQADSELVMLTADSGTAGAGIITGKVG